MQIPSKVHKPARQGVTLVELLVVLTIIGILTAILLPAAQMIREAARRTSCKNNMRQLGLAAASYESSFLRFPSSFEIEHGTVLTGNNGSWSIHGRLLPFIEQTNAYEFVSLDRAWDVQIDSGVPTLRIPTFMCPSELNDQVRVDSTTGLPMVHPQTYGFNMGTWQVYDPVNATPGDGPFYVNSKVTTGQIRDGLSNTMCAAEVKSYTSYIRNTSDPGATPPSDPNFFGGFTGQIKLGPSLMNNTGHTEWCDGRVHHSGVTTVFTPNTVVPYVYNGETYDIDFNSVQEGKKDDQSTYAAITSRSYHAGGLVNVVRMDGSVDSVHEQVDRLVWRAFGTISGAETSDLGKIN